VFKKFSTRRPEKDASRRNAAALVNAAPLVTLEATRQVEHSLLPPPSAFHLVGVLQSTNLSRGPHGKRFVADADMPFRAADS